MIDKIIANGHTIDQDATPDSLLPEVRKKFALSHMTDPQYRVILRTNWKPQAIALGVPVSVDGERSEASSAVSVWTDSPFLSLQECHSLMKRAEDEGLETGDFIFKQGYSGFERMKTGARRSSATKLIHDPSFTQNMESILANTLPSMLTDGRRLLGLRETFLLSRYQHTRASNFAWYL